MTLRERSGPPGGEPIGDTLDQYRAVLVKRRAAVRGRQPRLYLEFDQGIPYGTEVRMLDVAKLVGFEDVRLFEGYDFVASVKNR